MRRLHVAVVTTWLCFGLASNAVAQTTRSYTDGYEDAIKSSESIAALGPDAFGEQVNLKDGATSFSVTDVSVPTNSGLRVALSRALGINARDYDQYMDYVADGELLGNWKLEAPFMHGVYDEVTGWVSSMPNPQQRCSTTDQYYMPPPPRASLWKNGVNTFESGQYWSGVQVNIPGHGSESILHLPGDRTRPADGRTYYATTKSNWRISCLTTLLNATGEGFFAVLPDGTKYTFNWLSSRKVSALEDTVCNQYGCTSGIGMRRREYFIHATRAEDRFGNWVTYQYDAANPRLLTRIASSDGAAIDIAYAGGKVVSVTTAGRTWQYQYADAARTVLSGVVLPDQSRWSYQYDNIQSVAKSDTGLVWRDCAPQQTDQTAPPPAGQSVSMTHPSGLTGTFRFRKITHGTDNTPGGCYDPNPDKFGDEELSEVVAAYRTPSLYEKTVQGPGVSPQTWSYRYFPNWSWSPTGYVQPNCSQYACDGRTETHVTAPEGVLTRYVFGNDYWTNAGQMLEVHVGTSATTLQSTYTTHVASAAGRPFPDEVGFDPNRRNNPLTTGKQRPVETRTIHRQGRSFNSAVAVYDANARPLQTTKWSAGSSKTEVVTYHDSLDKWVLGQVSALTTAGIETSRTTFDSNAMPFQQFRFGKLMQTFGYAGDGTLSTVQDGRGSTTTLSSWHRGVPRLIRYPATAEAPSGATQSATVDDNGWITSITDENGFVTGYGYDAVGRQASVVFPTGDTTAWNNVVVTYQQIQAPDRGLPAGHWRQTRQQGNRYTYSYLDALWRPVLTMDLDASDATWDTQSQVIKRYDGQGRLEFQSYPTKHVGDFNQALLGVRTAYDVLGRPTQSIADSEHGALTTTTEYLAGFQTRVTNPRGQQTVTTTYQAYDEPSYDLPGGINHPEGAYTEIYRDIFGKPTALRRRNATASEDVWRRYVYDGYQQLCKTIEPETGATVMDYDAAGNLQWSAAGLTLPSTTSCDTIAGRDSGRKVTRYYDARNRVSSLTFPDGRGDQSWGYEKDGAVSYIVTNNSNGGEQVINRYTYSKRRMLTSESIEQPGWYTWSSSYFYDPNGALTLQTFPPTGLSVDYAPNALGQATRAGTYATNVSYYPNGAIRQFTYGNGIVHTMTQNARQLPDRTSDLGGPNTPLDYQYSYDPNGNVSYIGDLALGSSYSRWMSYDGLDRLTAAGSAMFGGDHWHRFTYDTLDNLKTWKLAGVKDHNYYYDPTQNRLTNVNTSTGAGIVGLSYDVQGNLSNRNGVNYAFDYGNRLREVSGKEVYRYDGHGRRVLAWSPAGGSIISQYTQSGQLAFQQNQRKNTNIDHIYLAGSLVATREYNYGTGAWATRYQHTDALGSPVAITNEAAQVVERTQWEPFGAAINKAIEGVGYTGHVMDAQTGLTYMQQRYYDPQIGRFLSVDPVQANPNIGTNFNRYIYGNNNPYKYIDPDGRNACPVGERGCVDSPRTESGNTRQPGPSSQQRAVDGQVKAASDSGRLSDGTKLDFSGNEQGFKASADGTSSNPMQTGCAKCSDGSTRETGSYNKGALGANESGGHTHTNRSSGLPGPEDGRLANATGKSAYVISERGAFSVEKTEVGYRIRTVDGALPSNAERSQMRSTIDGWNQNQGGSGISCSPTQC